MTDRPVCPPSVHGFDCCPLHECCACEEPAGGRSTWADAGSAAPPPDASGGLGESPAAAGLRAASGAGGAAVPTGDDLAAAILLLRVECRRLQEQLQRAEDARDEAQHHSAEETDRCGRIVARVHTALNEAGARRHGDVDPDRYGIVAGTVLPPTSTDGRGDYYWRILDLGKRLVAEREAHVELTAAAAMYLAVAYHWSPHVTEVIDARGRLRAAIGASTDLITPPVPPATTKGGA